MNIYKKPLLFPFKEINHLLHKLVYRMDHTSGELLQKHFKLTFSQFRILMAIKWKPELCQADVANYHMITPAAISRQIDLLEAKNLITKKQNKTNRREFILALTPKGSKLLEQAYKNLNTVLFQEMYQILSPVEITSLKTILEKLTNQKT